MIKPAPIGIFDSGYGGLTVFREIRRQLPQYDYIYLGDNARAPYGPRDFETIYHYTLECVQHLFDMGCQLVVLACNTASAKALLSIQQQDLPRIGEFQAGDDAQQRSFAASRRAEQGNQLSGRNVDGYVVQRMESTKVLADIADGDTHGAISNTCGLWLLRRSIDDSVY
mgnify:CR=1 FL=1